MNAHEQVINKQVVHLMKTLGCSEAEAIQIIKDDEAIDNGKKLFELSDEQKKVAKAMTSAGGGKHKEHKPREKKVDADKRDLMDAIDEALCDTADNVERVSDSEIKITYNDFEYTIKLIKHRKEKK